MKKILVLLFIFLIIWNVFAVKTFYKNLPIYLNVYTINNYSPNIWKNNNETYIKFWLTYDKTFPEVLYKLKKNGYLIWWANKYLTNLKNPQYFQWLYERDIFVYNKLLFNNDIYLNKGNIPDYVLNIYKTDLSLDKIKDKLSSWINYLYSCISDKISVLDTNVKKWVVPFKYAFCAKPVKFYYFNWKIFLNKQDYENYLQEHNINTTKSISWKLNYLETRLKQHGINNLLDKISIDVKNYVYRFYKPTLTKLQKEQLEYTLENKMIEKYNLYNWKIIIPSILWENDIRFIVDYYFNKYKKEIDNNYYNKLAQQNQYKQEALNNYWQLLEKYNKLKQEYENYKLKTIEDRQKAIKLTIILTKILSKYHNKETKLKLLDQIDNIIATKYWPDKFKNQDLIWYVKDYLKIIRLAIELSY